MPGIVATQASCLRASKRDIARAVEGVLGDATRFLLRPMLAHIDPVDATIERLDARIAEWLRPMSDACALVTEIQGINATTVAGVLAEIGTDTFERLRARLGPKQALIAIARKMLVALYHVLKNRTPYRELGADHVPTDQPERRAKKLVHQLKALGFDVQLAPTAVAPT